MIRPIALVLLAAGLAGCGTAITRDGQGAGSGQASYELRRTADGECRVRVTSGRDVSQGQIRVTEDCSLEAEASTLTGTETQMRLIDRLLERLP